MIKKDGLDKDALAMLLRLRYNPSPDTLFSQVKKIRPGHYCEVGLDNTRLSLTHRSYLSEIPATVNCSQAKAVETYEHKFEDAVKRQLLSDVEVGILLSGGIDSAMVAAVAQNNYSDKLKAFTIGFEGDHQEDEIVDAAETADLLGLEHYFRKITFTDFLSTIKECTRIVEEPLATTSMIPMYFLSELASEKVEVVLTGQGADEPLGGYARYKLELVRDRIPPVFRNAIIPIANAVGITNERALRGANSLGIKNEIERFLSVYQIFSVDEISNLISVDDKQSIKKIDYFYNLLKWGSEKHSVERMMALDSRLNLSDDLLNYTDKITMNFSMECRVPMLDLELVRFIESLPANFKLNMKEGKIVHKQFASKLLPDKIIQRKKRAFQSPTRTWFKNEADSIKELLLCRGTEFAAVFNQKYVAEIISQQSASIKRAITKKSRYFCC
jgi:asparagine synthase (glutamine-hydrolysing)